MTDELRTRYGKEGLVPARLLERSQRAKDTET